MQLNWIGQSLPELIIFSLLLLEEWLLVGTKQGHLLLYRIKKDVGKLTVRMTQEVDHIIFFLSCQMLL